MASLYIIGDPESGVLFVKTDPVMLTHINKATIQAYAASHGQSFNDVFGQIAAAAKTIMNKAAVSTSMPDVDSSYHAIGKLIEMGAVISDAKFCFVTELGNVDWASDRWVVSPISTALSNLKPPASPEDFVQLNNAPLD